ncbi:MAG TPA: RNA polymerase sigma factor [Mycobacteriales bacterium]|nr:RNA polymerase sigma factor [Mycobacteriales bacterium]
MSNPAAHGTLARDQAFRRFVEPEIEVLLRVARTLTGSWADAEDVVQDTLVRAWKAVDRFDGRNRRAWLLTILRRAHLNSLRRQRPDLIVEATDLDQRRPAFGAVPPHSAEDDVVDRMLSSAVESALAGLDSRYRTVLLLVDVDQLSYAEAAEVLGVPLGTVMSRLSRARDTMRRRLRAAGRSDERRSG